MGYLLLTDDDPPLELLLPPEYPELLLPENELLRLNEEDDWRLIAELLLILDAELLLLNVEPEADRWDDVFP